MQKWMTEVRQRQQMFDPHHGHLPDPNASYGTSRKNASYKPQTFTAEEVEELGRRFEKNEQDLNNDAIVETRK